MKLKPNFSLLDWCEEYMEITGCDWDEAVREYNYYTDPDNGDWDEEEGS